MIDRMVGIFWAFVTAVIVITIAWWAITHAAEAGSVVGTIAGGVVTFVRTSFNAVVAAFN
jgi:hypothetical protein